MGSQLLLALSMLMSAAADVVNVDMAASAVASDQPSAVLVEEMVVADDLLSVGGPNPVTRSSQPFVAVDAHRGRMWGADDPRLFAAAGRDEIGRAVEVRRSMFGTKPIRFGQEFTPAVVDGRVLIPGYRGGLFDLKLYQSCIGTPR